MAGAIVAVASGKGGVGKTWLSVTLAHALTRAGRRVLLVDADFGLANVDIQLGLLPAHDIGTVLSGTTPTKKAIIRHPCGFDVLAGRSGSATLANLSEPEVRRIADLIRDLAAGYELVLLDLASGLDRSVRHLSAAADTVLVVATEEPTSITDAYAVMKLHVADGGAPGGLRIVVNQATTMASGQRVYLSLARASERYLGTVPGLLGVIRRDLRVRDAIRHQMPLLQRHPVAVAGQDAEALAAALVA